MTKRIVVCQRCGREREHSAKNLCRSCYGYVLVQDKRVDCVVCGKTNAKYGGRNMCNSCLTKKSKEKNNTPERKMIRAEKERQRRKRLGDIYRQKERERNKSPERKEQKKASMLDWQRKNKPYLKEYRKEYRKRQPDIVKTTEQNRRARHKNAGHLSRQEWADIQEKYDHACYYCRAKGLPLEQEHKVPLIRGGLHNAENVVPACRECNARKYTKTDEEFIKSMRSR